MSGFQEYALLINKLSELSNCKKIASPRDAKIEFSRLLRRESFWIPTAKKLESVDSQHEQYKITKEECLSVNRLLKEAAVSILDIPEKLSGELRYQKSSTNYLIQGYTRLNLERLVTKFHYALK